MQYAGLRVLAYRYLRRFFDNGAAIDTWRIARRLEQRIPPTMRGPATRAVLQNLVSEVAARQVLSTKW